MLFFSCPLLELMLQKQLLSAFKDEESRVEWAVAPIPFHSPGFSALTICHGTRRLIVFNPRHPPTRRASSVVHEVSHVVLEHPPAPTLGEGGCRYWDSQLEDEADWQAAALLVPRDGAFGWLKLGRGLKEGADHFGVSLALFRWRVNKTGVASQLAAMGLRLN